MNTNGIVKLNVAGLSILRGTKAEVVASVLHNFDRGDRMRLAFCNAHMLALSLRQPRYADALSNLTLLNDGVGLDLAATLLLGCSFPDNLNGTDFIPQLLQVLPGSRIFLLGSKINVVAEAARRLEMLYPRHEIVGFRDGFHRSVEVAGIVDEIKSLDTDILLVGMGNPLQEEFVRDNGARLTPRLVICCGAFFDFVAGRIPRAPVWMQRLRLEWVFRLWQEPRRLAHRYSIEAGGLLADLVRIRMGRQSCESPLPAALLLEPTSSNESNDLRSSPIKTPMREVDA